MRKPQRKHFAPLLAILVLLPSLALAHGPSAHGHVRVHPRSSVNFGLSFGNGFYSPGYYSRGYYSPYGYGPSVTYGVPLYTPPVVIQQAPPVYIEQPAMNADASASNYWYYCAPTRSYYPYVGSCTEAWQRVSPVPPLESSPIGSKP
jgi:hypothetical protein